MIFLVGFGNEKTFSHIVKTVGKMPETVVLDLDVIANAETLSHTLTREGLSGAWGDQHFSISAHDVVFHRAYWREMGDARRSTYLAQFMDALAGLLMYPDVIAINPMHAGGQNMFKLAHLASLASLGFRIPETIAGAGETMSRQISPNGTWISKGCSAKRTEVITVGQMHYARMQCLKYAPVQFQKKAPGTDVRVHFFGGSYCAIEISTAADDYRYATQNGFDVGYTLIELPLAIVVKCREYMRREEMLFAGFDFRKDGDDWVVLECNPMPGFDFYDRKVDGAISKMIAREIEAMAGHSEDGSVLLREERAETFIERSRRPETDYS